MRHRNWFWGLFFLAAAAFVLAGQTIRFGEIGLWTILATICLAALAVQSGATRNFFGMFFSVALIYALYQKPLDLVHISFWLLMVAAAFASIGCSILFPSRWHRGPDGDWQGFGDAGCEAFRSSAQTIDDDNPSARVSFGSSCKYLHGDCLRSARFSVAFGKLDVFFDQAKLSPEGADVFIDCSFSGMELYLPKEWRIVDNLRADLGSVENTLRSAPPAPDAPRLTVNGSVSFGKVILHYI